MLHGPSLLPENPTNAVVFFHGYGSNGDDLLSLGTEWQSALPHTAFFSPNAPTPIWGNGYEWFSLSDFQSTAMVTPDYLHQLGLRAESVVPEIIAYLTALSHAYHIPLSCFTLVGFSQGGLMALKTAFSLSESVNGIIGMSSVPLDMPIQTQKRFNILLTHGEADDVVPIEALDLSMRVLKEMAQSVQTCTRPNMGHGVDSVCADTACRFIQKQQQTAHPST